eukprot:TRINITY_DN1119_c0_g1_i2.p1 TRINITY_DN1119_c0_g1~~TRINITY_DN1119_c0_g1_i2.p1  ORF type:complete len:972 (-),score=235.05 TRINITY_DN1119_c0_g1_i2:18846-21761(-)
MSYQVLARKWRPGKFSELVGQEHVVSAISNALDNDRLHHAYLFTGTRGVGKTTIARIFSKSLNCEEGQGANPCGQCNTCKEIEHGNYVDLLEIDAASRTKVEDTRELLDNVQYKPTRGRYKVYLIDEVHMLSKHSFNALLKTLEEPPPHVKFLLATTDPQKLPITILSRCLQFNLKALSREQIVGQLTHVLEQEALPFEPQALALLARAAQGSMRDALSLTDQAIAQGGNAVNAATVTDMLGLMDKNQLVKLLHAVVSKTPSDVMQLVQDMSEQAPDYDHVLAELGSTLHQIALTQWVPEACKLETTSAKAIYQLAKSISAEQVQLLYQIALQGRKDLPFSADGRSALEMTLMRMMTFAPSTPIADASLAINQGQSDTSLPIASTEKKTLTDDAQSHLASDSQGSQLNSPANTAAESETASAQESTEDATENGTEQAIVEKRHDSLAQSAPENAFEHSGHNASAPPAANNGDNHNGDNQDSTSAQPSTNQFSNSESTQSIDSSVTQPASLSPKEPASRSELASAIPSESPLANDTPQISAMPFDDMPPPDAYMDDMPPPFDEHHDEHAQGSSDPHQGHYGYSQSSADNEKSENNNYPQGSDGAEAAPTQTVAPEVQLTSTADMLALRQRLKQRKTQDTAAAAKKPEAVNNDSEGLVARMSKATQASTPTPTPTVSPITPSPTSPATSNVPDANDTPPWEMSAPQQSEPSSEAFGITDSIDDTDAPYAANVDDAAKVENAELGVNTELQQATDDTNEFSDDTVTNTNAVADGNSFGNSFTNTQGSAKSQPESIQPESMQAAASYDEAVASTENTSSLGEQPNSAHVSNVPNNGELTAYLPDGNKLVHASQIDSWSNLVEQMPIAGLLKQLVLHASFIKNDQNVTLEIDNSQAHLLNDSAKQQLLDVLHHTLGEDINITLSLGKPSNTPFALQQDIQAMRHAHAHTVVNTDETIQALLSAFDASVITDSVKAR